MTVELSIACAIHDQRIAETYLLPSLEALDGDPPHRFLLDNGGNAVSHSMAHLCNMLARLQGPSAGSFSTRTSGSRPTSLEGWPWQSHASTSSVCGGERWER